MALANRFQAQKTSYELPKEEELSAGQDPRRWPMRYPARWQYSSSAEHTPSDDDVESMDGRCLGNPDPINRQISPLIPNTLAGMRNNSALTTIPHKFKKIL